MGRVVLRSVVILAIVALGLSVIPTAGTRDQWAAAVQVGAVLFLAVVIGRRIVPVEGPATGQGPASR